jgi:hypothetical protein
MAGDECLPHQVNQAQVVMLKQFEPEPLPEKLLQACIASIKALGVPPRVLVVSVVVMAALALLLAIGMLVKQVMIISA